MNEPSIFTTQYRLLAGDCLTQLPNLESNSIDSLVTDPPAGISFMGKDWDDDKGGRKQWIAWMTEVMTECLRVLKPGAHGLVWAIPRTSHWTATALEDAGFEVRDVVTHLFGTGFPKSMDISKAIDKAAGAERDVLGIAGKSGSVRHGMAGDFKGGEYFSTAPATDAAKEWQGWGTALKPASEHWILVRKPISEKTVAANVLKWGTGGINIDASRIENHGKSTARVTNAAIRGGNLVSGRTEHGPIGGGHEYGRFPANLVLDEEAAAALDKQSLAGGMHSAGGSRNKVVESEYSASSFDLSGARQMNRFGDTGDASRFFYVAKASKKDKGEGNTHPTVKNTALMSYLIKLITPPNGVVLDPFTGSGSTGVAALTEGFRFIGIEREPEYIVIADNRIK